MAPGGLWRSSVEQLPSHGTAVFKDGAEQTREFVEHLRQSMANYPPGECKFENIDVSNCVWPPEVFEELMFVLTEQLASAKRFKAFKCQLSDESVRQVIRWLGELPDADLPSEIHLSHNQMSKECFMELVEVLEKKREALQTQLPAVWVRVEGNKIQQPALDALVQAGRAVLAPRIQCPERVRARCAVALPSFPEKQAQAQQQAGSGWSEPIWTPGKSTWSDGQGWAPPGAGPWNWTGKGKSSWDAWAGGENSRQLPAAGSTGADRAALHRAMAQASATAPAGMPAPAAGDAAQAAHENKGLAQTPPPIPPPPPVTQTPLAAAQKVAEVARAAQAAQAVQHAQLQQVQLQVRYAQMAAQASAYQQYLQAHLQHAAGAQAAQAAAQTKAAEVQQGPKASYVDIKDLVPDPALEKKVAAAREQAAKKAEVEVSDSLAKVRQSLGMREDSEAGEAKQPQGETAPASSSSAPAGAGAGAGAAGGAAATPREGKPPRSPPAPQRSAAAPHRSSAASSATGRRGSPQPVRRRSPSGTGRRRPRRGHSGSVERRSAERHRPRGHHREPPREPRRSRSIRRRSRSASRRRKKPDRPAKEVEVAAPPEVLGQQKLSEVADLQAQVAQLFANLT